MTRMTKFISEKIISKAIEKAGLPAERDALKAAKYTLDNVEADINKRESDLAHQVRAVVGSCTTVKKLLEIWPESKELIPTTLEEARPQLPAIQVAELNKLVGLPSGEQNV